MNPPGKLPAAGGVEGGLGRASCAKAEPAARSMPKSPASLPRCRRVSLPCIDFPYGLNFTRRRTLQRPVGLERIDLIRGNPVDLKCHHDRRLAVDHAHASEIFRSHREIDD